MSRQSISVNIVGYSLSRSGKPEIRLQLDNESRGSIYSASCSIAALSGNRVLDTARTFFAGLDPISAGESAVDTGTWLDTDGGFSSFERIRVQCDWLDGVGLAAVDITSGPISVDFVGYTSEFGSPAVTLLMTNNGSQTIYSAGCGVEAKRGNLILDTASLFFADLGDIRPGEAAEDTGSWRELSSLDEFDAEPFDIANVNCSYLVRR